MDCQGLFQKGFCTDSLASMGKPLPNDRLHKARVGRASGGCTNKRAVVAARKLALMPCRLRPLPHLGLSRSRSYLPVADIQIKPLLLKVARNESTVCVQKPILYLEFSRFPTGLEVAFLAIRNLPRMYRSYPRLARLTTKLCNSCRFSLVLKKQIPNFAKYPGKRSH